MDEADRQVLQVCDRDAKRGYNSLYCPLITKYLPCKYMVNYSISLVVTNSDSVSKYWIILDDYGETVELRKHLYCGKA